MSRDCYSYVPPSNTLYQIFDLASGTVPTALADVQSHSQLLKDLNNYALGGLL
jgi:hypothetical protein